MFKTKEQIEFEKNKNDERNAILGAMAIDDVFEIEFPHLMPATSKGKDIKSWRNCAYYYGLKTEKVFGVRKSKGKYYVVRNG